MAATFEDALKQLIRTSRLIISVHDMMTKWRIQLKGGYVLDVYFNASSQKYSYTLIKDDSRVLGWDNAPHHPGLANFPHHFRDADGSLRQPHLTGIPSMIWTPLLRKSSSF